MPKRDDITSVLVIDPPDRHRPGLRVRLLRHPGVPGAARGGHPGHPRQQQPGDDHDRPRDSPTRPTSSRSPRRSSRRSSPRNAPTRCSATLGGQTALNCAIALHDNGVLEKYNCPLIGANVDAINLGEDREKFKGVVERCGAESAKSLICPLDGRAALRCGRAGLPRRRPAVVHHGRPRLGFAYDEADLRLLGGAGLQYPDERRCSSRSRSSAGRIRARGHARPRRQRRRRLLHREPRPHG